MALRRAVSSLAQRFMGVPQFETGLINSVLKSGVEESIFASEQVRHASNQAVKQRIRAIGNIGKITKAMKMVASSKMRNAQAAVILSRGCVDPFVRLFGDHPAIAAPRGVTVAVTSDRGLCGGLNSNITKNAKALFSIIETDDNKQTVVTIGDKGRSQLGRIKADYIGLTVADAYKTRVTFAQASLLSEEILKLNPDAVRILYNKFGSAISFKPTVATVLTPGAAEKQLEEPSGNKLDVYEVEASHERSDVLKDLAEFHLASTLYNALLENNCSEHASRMTAMENSSKSAGDILGALTLKYNRKRQASITTELIEIIAGASALVDSE